jgi:hypothetical protein
MMDRNLTFCGGSATTSSTVSTRARRMFAGLEVSGCSHGLVGRLSDVCGCVDKAAAGWFGDRHDLVGRDLLSSHPPHSLKPRLALFDGDLSLALGSHADDPGWSSQTRVINVPYQSIAFTKRGQHTTVSGHPAHA